jgi:hypothetical protein
MTPFYEKAKALWQRTQDAQILKGLQKYPEPFNPHSWTPEQLLNHALEETVDLTHYLVGLKELLDAKDKEIQDWIDAVRSKDKEIANLKANENGWKEKAIKYETLYDKVCMERENLKRLVPKKSPFEEQQLNQVMPPYNK